MNPRGFSIVGRGETKEKDLQYASPSELMTGFEPVTSSLPRMRSTD